MTATTNNKRIDAVIAWVDGDDPEHRRKRLRYMNGNQSLMSDNCAGNTRYRSLGEIDWCVFSILKFAPFFRKIFIVTDNQNPHVERLVNKYFPDSTTPIEIVDHKVIFKDYEQSLPTFNSLSIATMLWRIPDLQERFVYFNDDIMLWNPVQPTDFYAGNDLDIPIVYGYWHLAATAALIRVYNRLRGKPGLKFRDFMLNASRLVYGHSFGKFIRHEHTPLPLRKSFFEDYFKRDPEPFIRNSSYRFRNENQFSAVSLHYLSLALKGEIELREHNDALIYLSTSADNSRHTRRAVEDINRKTDAKFCCLNTFDKASENQRRYFTEIINRHFGITT